MEHFNVLSDGLILVVVVVILFFRYSHRPVHRK